MRKLRLFAISILLLVCAGYLAYRLYFPVMVAKSFSSKTSPLLPEDIQLKIEKVKKPVNKSAELIVARIHQSEGVTMDDLLNAIDNVEEDQAFAFLDKLNKTEIVSPDQVFSMAKKHFPVDFNIEIFRKPFSEKANVPMIRKMVHYANIYKSRNEIDAETAKSIVKRILLQKEEEFNKLLTKTN